jgi:hypothetical protein
MNSIITHTSCDNHLPFSLRLPCDNTPDWWDIIRR